VRAPVATSSEDATASGTALAVEARLGALESVADVIADVPGVRVTNTGGAGSSSGVALRGASIAHTTVLLGDIPLNTPDTGAFDLSMIPLEALDAVEVYRGGAPAWWSDGAIGGVVRLVPRRAKQRLLQARAGYGSFGHFELAGTSSLVLDGGALLSHAGFMRTDNDYAYVDDGQMRFDPSDVTLEQRNAQIDAGNGLLHASVDLYGGRLDLLATAHGRTEGVPGPLASPTDHVRHKLVRVLGALAYTLEGRGDDGERDYRVQALASASHQNNQLTDLDRELGISRAVASDDDWNRGYARLAGSVAATSFLEPTVVLSASRDDYLPANPLALSAAGHGSGRTTLAAALEPRVHGTIGATQLELRPSVRGQWTETSVWNDSGPIEMQRREQQSDTLATYRIAGLVAPLRWLSFAASYATGARVPSILELFGDRVYQVANLELQPERSRTADVSTVLKGRAGELRGSVELRGFVLLIDELINYRRTSQFTVRAENIDSAEILGAELGLQGSLGRHFALHGSATTLRTRNQFDNDLPLRPPLLAQARPEISLFPSFADRIALFAELEHTSFMYLDNTNRTLLEERTLFTVGGMAELLDEQLTLALRVHNVTDQAATDVLSRPLPGTQVMLSVSGQSSLF
jgi:iron complex outermembrane receptor protein